LEGLAAVSPPPGRLEPIDTGERGFRVFVDYAHTPDALQRVLGTLGELLAESAGSKQGRLLCVFGCGGERDRDKRPSMGAAVAARADVALVTSDNPRGEDPEAILQDVLAGMRSARAEIVVEPDRRKAIRRALELARPGDLVLIAGKGHEAWQQLSDRRIPFDDRLVALEELS
jgi:UDP-N-acetylmuramoyl-L-alanyl-D-glutamate--2,6-diaminopimelate ligase